MPGRAPVVCRQPGCLNLVVPPKRYCKQHEGKEQPADRGNYYRHYDKHKRNQKARVFYQSKAWQAIRHQALIRDNYLCQDCVSRGHMVRAVMVHHIVPILDAWELRLSMDNLTSLCQRCHGKREH